MEGNPRGSTSKSGGPFEASDKLTLPKPQSSELRLFLHQVTGHNILLKYDGNTVCKPFKERETLFYRSIPPSLQPFVPRFKGTIDVEWVEDESNFVHIIGKRLLEPSSDRSLTPSPVSTPTSPGGDFKIKIRHSGDDGLEIEPPKNMDNMDRAKVAMEARLASHPWSLNHYAAELNNLRQAIEREGKKTFILLENLAQRFAYPCILDLKMGTQLHGDEESEAKKERKTRRGLESTSHELGVRLGGMEVYDVVTGRYSVFDKYYGRSLSPAQLKTTVRQYFHNGRRCRFEVVEQFRCRLTTLKKTLADLDSFRFFSSSLLLIYDGSCKVNIDESSSSLSTPPDVDVRMVDFAHSTWTEIADECKTPRYSGADNGYLLGLQTVLDCLTELSSSNNGSEKATSKELSSDNGSSSSSNNGNSFSGNNSGNGSIFSNDFEVIPKRNGDAFVS